MKSFGLSSEGESISQEGEAAALHQAHKFSEQLINSSVDGILAFDRECRYTVWNPAMERITGVSKVEVLGKCAFEVFPFLKETGEDQFMLDALVGKPTIGENRLYVNSKGRHIFFEGHYSPLRTEVGEIIGGLALIRDITEQRQAEAALRDSEVKYSVLVEQAIDGIVIVQDGVIQFCNRAAAEGTGYSIDELVGQSISDLAAPESKNLFMQMQNARLRGAAVPSLYEAKIQCKDGTRMDVEISAGVIQYQGRPAAMGSIRGITARKQAEAALQESEEKYRTLFETARNAITITSREGRYLDANPATVEQYGYTQDELYQKNVRELYVHPEERDRFQQELEEKGTVKDYELQFQKKDGTVIDCLVTSTVRRSKSGEVLGYQNITIDITARRQAETLLRTERDRAQQYLDVAGVLIYALDLDQKVAMINKKGCEILGYSEEEILGTNWFDKFLLKGVQDELKTAFEQIMANEREPSTYRENAVLTKSDEERIIAWHNALLTDSTDKIIGLLCSGTDITEQKRAEEALRESETKYSALVERAQDGVYIVQDNALQFGNQALAEISGYSINDLMGMSFLKLIAPESRELIAQRHQARMAGEPVPSFYETPVQCKDGTIKTVELSVGLTQYQGRPATMGFVRDITERKQAEAALQESEEKFRLLSEQALLGITMLQDNVIKYVNQATADLFDYTIEEMLNWKPNKFAKHIHPDDRSFAMEQARKKQAGEEGVVTHYSYRILTKTGELRWVDQYSKSVIYEGRFADLVTMIDITARVKAEAARRESEDQYSTLVEHAKDGVFIEQDGVFEFTNRAMAEISGYSINELRGMSLLDTVIPESRGQILQQMEWCKAGKTVSMIFELKILCKNKTVKDVEISVGLIQYQGRPASMGIVRDLTMRKQEEAAHLDLEAKRKNFIEVTSHELRTPLTSISGYSEILELRWDELDQTSRIRSFEVIRRNVQRLEQLIEGVSSLGQIEREVLRLNVESQDFCNFLVEALQPYQTSLRGQVEFHPCQEGPSMLQEMDVDRIHQVLANLMDNAIKNTSKDHRKLIVTYESFPIQFVCRFLITGPG